MIPKQRLCFHVLKKGGILAKSICLSPKFLKECPETNKKKKTNCQTRFFFCRCCFLAKRLLMKPCLVSLVGLARLLYPEFCGSSLCPRVLLGAGLRGGGDIMEEMGEVSCVFVGRCFMDQSLLNTRYKI